MAKLFGPECEFLSTSYTNFDNPLQFVERIVAKIRDFSSQMSQQHQKQRRFTKHQINTGTGGAIYKILQRFRLYGE